MSDRDTSHLVRELQEARAEVEYLRRFRRAVLVVYDQNQQHGPGAGTDFALQMILEISDEYEKRFGQGGAQ